MLEYQFVRIDLRGIIENKPVQDYHGVVHEHAAQGWRLLQIFAPNTQGFGTANYFELIFEREVRAK
ncbi:MULTISPECIES: DUF4177 domain-containing protein [Paenibacillus]|jgi:hypothetical protein|uniref:DUF4177 domain-containing protein n=1 Tax=Paenibacillus auburnensis TaxID=2905649 RepID=A0ABM9CS00_9BACL|nr:MULTISPECIES: DUF4177 domain-containing protein [Paenibacillus]CAH1220556.1 hypothetical protein PAECIP111892_04867 [Paenibacillus auburnensis]